MELTSNSAVATGVALKKTAPVVYEDPSTRDILLALTQKVDQLAFQVDHLYQRTVALEELKDELMHIARDGMTGLQQELSAIENEFNADEVGHLLRKLLRNTPRFIRMLDHLESIDGLLMELGPLGKEIMHGVVLRLQAWEEQGHFELGRKGIETLDQAAALARDGKLDWLSDRFEQLAALGEKATNPALLALAEELLTKLGGQGPAPKRVGLFGMMRATRDHDVQRGLGLLLDVAKTIGARAAVDESKALPAADTKLLKE